MIPSSFNPALLYIPFKSSFKSLIPYVDEITICTTLKPHINAAKRDNDCLPEPPTPTNNACPPEFMTTRTILAICFIASSNNTKSIVAFVSLYSLKASSSTVLILFIDFAMSYTLS